MAVLDIVRIGEPVLRLVADPVGADELATPGFQRFLDDLVETMRAANGAGLAAPQVGVARRVFCVEVRDNPRYPYKPDLDLRVLVNPELRVLSDETFMSYEGCLSISDLRGLLPRALEVEVAYTDREGNRVVEEVRGLSRGHVPARAGPPRRDPVRRPRRGHADSHDLGRVPALARGGVRRRGARDRRAVRRLVGVALVGAGLAGLAAADALTLGRRPRLCGEHTAGAHAALMEGALRSGLRVADEVRAAAA